MVARTMPRPNTYARWERACARAVAEGTRVLADDGRRALVTASDGRTLYLIAGDRCPCRAGQQGDLCCKHLGALHLSRTAGGDDTPPAAPSVCPA